MHIKPLLIIGGVNVSDFVVSIHSEQTANEETDANKYDIKLANVGGRFFNFFDVISQEAVDDEDIPKNPKTKIKCWILRYTTGCDPHGEDYIKIFEGECQYVMVDEIYCEIKGSCTQGGFSSQLKKDWTWQAETTTLDMMVRDLLIDYGIPEEKMHIHPKNKKTPKKTVEFLTQYDFDRAIDELAEMAQSIYFFDENDDFWFVPAINMRGAQDVTGSIIRSSAASTMIGYCNKVQVYGGCPMGFEPGDPGSEILKQTLVYAEAIAEDEGYGIVAAPPIYVKNCNQKECQAIADRMLEEYQQYKDNPKVKLSGRAPLLLSKVSYFPYNANAPAVYCHGAASGVPITDSVAGLVVRRVVDFDTNNGFVCELELATHMQAFEEAGKKVFLDSAVIDWHGVDYAVDSPTTVLLSYANFADAMKDALAKNPDMTYAKFQADPSTVLAYNPDTGDAQFAAKLTFSTFWPGYYQAYPALIGQDRLSTVLDTIAANGWPDLSAFGI